jgi:hypothetical protein
LETAPPEWLTVLGRGSLWLRTRLPRIYLTRFSYLLALLLVGIVPFARKSPAMFQNLLIAEGTGLKWIALFATAAALTVMATRRIVLLYGPARFDMQWPDVGRDISLLTLVGHCLLALPIIVVTILLTVQNTDIGLVRAVALALQGIVYAVLMMLVATILYALHADPDDELPDVVVPSNRAVRMAHHAKVPDRIKRALPAPPAELPPAVNRLRDFLWMVAGPGYFGRSGRLLPAHWFATGLLLVFCAFYAVGYFFWKPGTPEGAGMPALVYVLVVSTLATWFLTIIAFFLDRHRLPTLLPVILWSAVVWTFWSTDHYFSWSPDIHSTVSMESPAQVVGDTKPEFLVIVAIDGGGIQASAWATTVLTRVQHTWPGFRRSARLVSAVSGGSVGAMYFVSLLSPTHDPTDDELEQIRELARRGSLNETAWGIAYPDLWRILVPVPRAFRERDRGWAIEQAWRRDWPHMVPWLSELRRGIREGWRPAITFNAVGVESGQRVALATFAPPGEWNLETLDKLYGGGDISISTAARLSATFPYVSPISRAAVMDATGSKATHFADGGYYDNTGMGIAMRWLDAALQGNESTYRGKRVAFVRIRSSPASSSTERKERGWLYETIGPVQTILATRVAGQNERAKTELDFVRRLWCAKGVDVNEIEFGFDQRAPLTWQLTQPQRNDLDLQWQSDRNRASFRRLLVAAADPSQSTCPPQ